MKTRLKVALVLAAGALSLNLLARAERGGERRGPPPEAFEACVGATVGDTCVVETPHGTLEGTCRQARRSDDLVCVPNNHRRGGPPRGQES